MSSNTEPPGLLGQQLTPSAAHDQGHAREWPAAQTPLLAKHNSASVQVPRRSGLSQTPRAVAALVIREMSTTYGRSPTGFAWVILEPVAGILLLTFVFSLAFSSPPIGVNFALFYASGLLPFSTYIDLNTKIAHSIGFSKALLSYPRISFLDAIAARLFLNALINILITVILFTLLIEIYRLDQILDIPAMALSVLMAICFALGVGVINCYLFTFYPAWQFAWAVLNRPLFVVSCVLFVYDSVPQPYKEWLWWNPLVHIVGQMRAGVYPTYEASYVSPVYVFGVSGILVAIGLMLLLRYHRDIANT